MKRLVLVLLAGALLTAPVAIAGHGGDTITVHKTYEAGATGDVITLNCVTGNSDLGTSCDPTGQTQDGSIDVSGAIFTPDDVEPGVDEMQASIVDDVFGANVIGGWLCTDEDGNDVCGESDVGEVGVAFCGQSGAHAIPPAPNWDSATVFTNGPVFQSIDCDPTAAPTSVSGGVLNPAAGIFVTFG